jgi:O-antigen/teichoic acid export membrane protein
MDKKSRAGSILTNTGSTVLIRGFVGAARILLLLLIAGKFGPTDFGRLSLALSVVELFRFGADLGLDTVLVRQFSISQTPAEKLLSASLILKGITGTAGAFMTVSAFSLVYRNIEALDLVLVLSVTFYTTLLTNAYMSYYQARLEMGKIIIPSITGAAAYVLLTLSGLWMGWSLVALCAILPLSEFLNLCLIWRAYRSGSRLVFSFDQTLFFSLLKEGFPVALSNMMVVTYMRLDNLMLGWFLGETAVGEYAAAFRVTEPFMLVFTSLSISVYAFFSKGFHDSPKDMRSHAGKIIGWTLVGALSVAAVLSFFSKGVMVMISEAYRNSADVLLILAWAVLFKAVNAQLTAIINSQGRYDVIATVALVILGVAIGLNLLLIPAHGIIGAALSVLSAEGLNTAMQLAYVTRLLKDERTAEKR